MLPSGTNWARGGGGVGSGSSLWTTHSAPRRRTSRPYEVRTEIEAGSEAKQKRGRRMASGHTNSEDQDRRRRCAGRHPRGCCGDLDRRNRPSVAVSPKQGVEPQLRRWKLMGWLWRGNKPNMNYWAGLGQALISTRANGPQFADVVPAAGRVASCRSSRLLCFFTSAAAAGDRI